MREQNQHTQQVHQPLETAKRLLSYQLSTYQLSRQQLELVKAKILSAPQSFKPFEQRKVLSKIQRELQEIKRREQERKRRKQEAQYERNRREQEIKRREQEIKRRDQEIQRGKEMDQRIKKLFELQQSSTKKQIKFENDLKQNTKISNLSFNFQKMLKGFQEYWLGSRGYQMESEDGSRKTFYQPNPRAAYQQQHQSLLSSFQSSTFGKTTQNKDQQQMTKKNQQQMNSNKKIQQQMNSNKKKDE